MGNLNTLFLCGELYRGTGEVSITLIFSENRGFASIGSGDATARGG
jgi:hypothetical protein